MIINSNTQYWFTIEPYVYVSVGKHSTLLYNTLDGNTIITKQRKIRELIDELYLNDNCGVTLLADKRLVDKDIQSFVTDLRDKFMGDIIDVSLSLGKPVQLVPQLNLQTDIKKLKQDDFRSVGEQIMNYLQEINIHFTEKGISSYEYFRFLLQIPKFSSLQLINLFDNIEYQGLINKTFVPATIISSYNKFILKDLSFVPENFKFKVIVEFPVDTQQWHESMDILFKQKCSIEFVFKVTSNEDCEEAEKIIDQYNIENYELEPIYTGDNISFFEENIFPDENDILSTPLSMREIFAHQALNTFNFGKIHIMDNGDVHANIHHPALGNITAHSIQEILYREMNEGKSWLRIRDQKPCSDCIYQYLCPSPSNYEIVIGRPNLCNIINNK
jgi:pseudo-rSAM protein